ncbi:MAG: agmatine deiminase family protein [Bacteroidales bacterium]|nr:agmatine deiminase family protein [Bacteroidales bacterium]
MLALACWPPLYAQPNLQQAAAEWRQSHWQRVPLPPHHTLHLSPPTAVSKPIIASKGNNLPTGNRWIPGEWEEVQAIVLTPIYDYKPIGVAAPDYWFADPLVTGWADLYEYARTSPTSRTYSWQHRGTGHYYGRLDTTSNQSRVPFLLMDAIQQANAEAWVRVEQPSDSTIILRHLQHLGLRHDRLRFFAAPANLFWYRDCGPICFYYGEADSIGMLDFQYYTGRALDDSLPAYISRHFGLPRFTTTLKWEGGNCLTDGVGSLFTTSQTYVANATDTGQYTWDGINISTLSLAPRTPLTASQVSDSLRHLLASPNLHIFPALQYDGGTGHIDLYLDMPDENTFALSRMPDRYSRWIDFSIISSNADSLASYTNWQGIPYRFATLPFPLRDNGAYFASQSQYEAYTRTYSNHLLVNGMLIQPCFSAVGDDGLPTAAWDRTNVAQVAAAYPGYKLYCIDVRPYDGLGGALHCLTKQIPAASPIRILHTPPASTMPALPQGDSIPLQAYITNNKGIAEATLHYRTDGSQWQSLPLYDQGQHTYTTALHLTPPAEGKNLAVDYYLSATNTQGKTITRPITALQGGYFSFSVGINNTPPTDTDTTNGFGQFYPNPTSSLAKLNICLSSRFDGRLTLTNTQGKTVLTRWLSLSAGKQTLSLPLSTLPAGLYTAHFSGSGQSIIRQLIIN